MLQENNVRKGFFEHDEYLRMKQALPEEVRPLLVFAYHTACRKGEILFLRWDQARRRVSALRIRLLPGLHRAGVPKAVAMRISGHRTRSLFDRYNIVSEHDLNDAAAKLGACLAQKTARAENWHTTGTQEPSRGTLERPAKSALTH